MIRLGEIGILRLDGRIPLCLIPDYLRCQSLDLNKNGR